MWYLKTLALTHLRSYVMTPEIQEETVCLSFGTDRMDDYWHE